MIESGTTDLTEPSSSSSSFFSFVVGDIVAGPCVNDAGGAEKGIGSSDPILNCDFIILTTPEEAILLNSFLISAAFLA
jgi:hypothetical protein